MFRHIKQEESLGTDTVACSAPVRTREHMMSRAKILVQQYVQAHKERMTVSSTRAAARELGRDRPSERANERAMAGDSCLFPF